MKSTATHQGTNTTAVAAAAPVTSVAPPTAPLNFTSDIPLTTMDQKEIVRQANEIAQMESHRRRQPPNLNSRESWNRLPAEIILLIAYAVDWRSLIRMESIDRFTSHAIRQSKSCHQLWHPRAQLSSHLNLQLTWIYNNQDERRKLIQFEQNPTSITLLVKQPKQYFCERWKIVQSYHQQFKLAHYHRQHSHVYKCRVMTLRWYDEYILPILFFLLLTLFLSFLIYELSSNDHRITWLTMSPLLVCCGLIVLSTYFLCYIKYRAFQNEVWTDPRPSRVWPPHDPPDYDSKYDIAHFIADDYVRESKSFITKFMSWFDSDFDAPRPPCENSESGPDRRTDDQLRQEHRALVRGKTRRTIHACVIFAGLILFIVFLSLRVTGTVTWSWSVVLTPFFVSFSLISFFSCLSGFGGILTTLVLIAVYILLSPLITFISLLTVYLNHLDSRTSEESSSLTLHEVFIPLYIVEGISFCALVLLLLTSIKQGYDRIPDLIKLVFWFLMIGPFVWLQIALGLNADRNDGSQIVSPLDMLLPLAVPLIFLFYKCIPSRGERNEMRYRAAILKKEAATKFAPPDTIEQMEENSLFNRPVAQLNVAVHQPIQAPPLDGVISASDIRSTAHTYLEV